jgi:hypothetical protein
MAWRPAASSATARPEHLQVQDDRARVAGCVTVPAGPLHGDIGHREAAPRALGERQAQHAVPVEVGQAQR